MAGTFLDDRQVVNRAALSALGNTANLTLDVIMGDINTFFANATASATASVLMLRDANANTRANNFIEGFTTTATAAGTTTLTVASTYFQQFTGTTTQTVVLPNATTLVAGQAFLISNRSTGYVTVNANGGGLVQTMAPGSQTLLTVTSIGTSAGTWDSSYSVAGPIPFLQTNVTTDSTTTGSAATLLAGDILYGDVRLTNASLVSVSGIPAGASGQQLIIENQTGNTITINNNDAGATAANRIFTGTGGAAQMAANASFEFVYDTTTARWMLVGGTGSGSGSGSKNYLTTYTASTSSGVPNTGNGNFELGSTTGWNLVHSSLTSLIPTSVGSGGNPFSTSNGGSAASGNLSLTTVTSGNQLSGSYSGDLASSAASTAGDMLISNAFFIDSSDQNQVMTISFDYKLVSGSANTTFSGSSSNTFAIYIYDCFNNVWIQPANTYTMNQNSGIGHAVATFQTASNGIRYQLALVNINASTGAYSLYVDDFSVGPNGYNYGIIPTANTITRLTSGSGTYTVPAGVYQLKVTLVGGGGGGAGSGNNGLGGAGTAGSPTTFGTSLLTAAGGGAGTQATGGQGTGGGTTVNSPAIAIVAAQGGTGSGASANDSGSNLGEVGGAGGNSPFGGAGGGGGGTSGAQSAGLAASPNSGSGGGGGAVSSNGGNFVVGGSGGGAGGYIVALIPTASLATSYAYSVAGTSGGGGAGTNGVAGGNGGSGVIIIEEFYYGQNVQLSSAAAGNGPAVFNSSGGTATGTISSTATNANIVFPAGQYDNYSGYNATTGVYTVPATGFYFMTTSVEITSTTITGWEVNLQHNGSTFAVTAPIQASSTRMVANVSLIISCNAGDTLSVANNNFTGTGSPSYQSGCSNFQIMQIPNAQQILAATASVNMRYTDVSGSAVTSTPAIVAFGTKGYDSHGTFGSPSGTYVVPISGKYSVKSSLWVANTTTLSGVQRVFLTVLHNGSANSFSQMFGTGSANAYSCTIADTINCVAGDTIAIQFASSITTTLNTTAGVNFIAIERVGN